DQSMWPSMEAEPGQALTWCRCPVPWAEPDDFQTPSAELTAVHVAPMDGGGSGSRPRREGRADGSHRTCGDPTSASDDVRRCPERHRPPQIGRSRDRRANRLRELRAVDPGGSTPTRPKQDSV